MEIMAFLKENWVVISFFVGEIAALVAFAIVILKVLKCSLRNDMLDIWDRCKESKKITKYQLQSFMYSYELYDALNGNSFIEEIKERISVFEITD